MPKSGKNWKALTSSRLEAARLWGDLVERHYRIRRANRKWPNKMRWQEWAKGKYPNLYSQSVQQVIGEFCEAVISARALRSNGHAGAEYPSKKSKFRDVIYTNQSAKVKDGFLTLPNGKSGKINVKLPKDIIFPGRLMEVRMGFGTVLMVFEVEEKVRVEGKTIGVDLGINTLIAATDGKKAILVSGRGAKATVQWRNKRLSSIQARQDSLLKHGRRWKLLQRRKAKMLAKAANRITDVLHKATRKVADAFPNAKAYVGKPFNEAAEKMWSRQAQQVSSACNARIIRLLDYKLCGAIEVDERYSSQTCPVCGRRRKCQRVYRCECGLSAPRDLVGATDILSIGTVGSISLGREVARELSFVLPCKYPGHKPGSSGGHPASSLAIAGQESASL